MGFQDDPTVIRWRMHLAAPPEEVYRLLATESGRACFWAESAIQHAEEIEFIFPGNHTWRGAILEHHPPSRFAVRYLGGSVATFLLGDDGDGGTDLELTDAGVAAEDRQEVIAGWVSVLLALKAAADFSVDLRNHDPRRTWDVGYVDN